MNHMRNREVHGALWLISMLSHGMSARKIKYTTAHIWRYQYSYFGQGHRSGADPL